MTIATVSDDDINIAPDDEIEPKSKPSIAFVRRARDLARGRHHPARTAGSPLFASDVELELRGEVWFHCRYCFPPDVLTAPRART